MSDRRYVAMFGSGLGAVTELAGGTRRVVWDQHVKHLPADVAEQLLRSPSFVEALPLSELPARFSLAAETVDALVEQAAFPVFCHTARDGRLVPVVVLDDSTRKALAAAIDSPNREGATP